MTKTTVLNYEFIRAIPEKIEEDTLYISVDFATAVHKCCCGCGKEVVTPLSPTDWKLIFDGVSVSLNPSIGNWSFACKSHYWIERNNIRWAPQWTDDQIAAGRSSDLRSKQRYYRQQESTPAGRYKQEGSVPKSGLFSRFWRWLTGDD